MNLSTLESQLFKPHAPETCDCGRPMVRKCRCGKPICQHHGYQLEDSHDLLKRTVLCGECKAEAEYEELSEMRSY